MRHVVCWKAAVTTERLSRLVIGGSANNNDDGFSALRHNKPSKNATLDQQSMHVFQFFPQADWCITQARRSEFINVAFPGHLLGGLVSY